MSSGKVIMGKHRKKKKSKPKKRSTTASPETVFWQDKRELQAVLPAMAPKEEFIDKLSQNFQKEIRNSPLWQQMVEQFGLEMAEQLLKQCRAELR